MKRYKSILPGTVLFIFLIVSAEAQNVPPLERVVTISFHQDKIDVVLSKLSQQGKFIFSYNPSILDLDHTVSASFVKKSVREILLEILDGTIQFKEKGNYIILTRAVSVNQKTAEVPLIISGYVLHAGTGEKLPQVSIYDKRTLAAAVSNQYGYFKLKVDNPARENNIAVSKKNYRDTVIILQRNDEEFLNIVLTPEIPIIVLPPQRDELPVVDSVEVVPSIAREGDTANESKPLSESQINMRNIKDTLYRKFQISYVPFIGTNHKLSGNVINDYSVNVIGGYSLGTRRAEIGGIFNIERGDVAHTQVGGVFNAVGGDVTGMQIAGNFNMTNGKVDALQVGGIMNFNLHEVKGVQIAGIININGDASQGVQIAGITNLQVKNYKGTQIAGLLNVATHGVSGTQISGGLNYGTHVRGSQIGFINIADTVQGVPVGFISLVRKGYHKIEIAADEIFYTNIAFRTGVRQFYNIFTAGIKPENFNEPFWTVGYGIGSAPKLTKRIYLNFDLTSNHVSLGDFTLDLSLLNKFYIGTDIQITKNFSLTMGATLNGYLTKGSNSEIPSLFTHYEPHIFSDRNISDNARLQMWWGGKIGVRFL